MLLLSPAGVRTFVHTLLCAAALSACAQSPVGTVDGAHLWDAVQQAQQGHRRVAVLRFHTWDELMVGAGEAFYPELAPTWAAHNVFDYAQRRFSQAAMRDGDRLDWDWDGHRTTLRRNGVPYTPTWGIPRVQHLRVNAWLLAPVQAMVDSGVQPRVLPPRNGAPRLGFGLPGPPAEDVVLELDARTLRVAAVEYTARAVGFPGAIRASFRDERRVDGLWVPHHIVETTVADVHFHDVWVHDVEVAWAPAGTTGGPRWPR